MSEEELLRAQEELFAKSRQKYQAGRQQDPAIGNNPPQ